MKILISVVVAFFVGAILAIVAVEYEMEIRPVELVTLLTEQCDEEEIKRLRSYECQTQLTPILTYKDGDIEDIAWE